MTIGLPPQPARIDPVRLDGWPARLADGRGISYLARKPRPGEIMGVATHVKIAQNNAQSAHLTNARFPRADVSELVRNTARIPLGFSAVVKPR